MSNLDSFVKFSKPPPKPLATSQEIRDRGSTFVGTVYAATSPEAARKAINHLKHVAHGVRLATHEIAAWRCMVLKAGKVGLGGPDDFEVVSGWDDDGDKYGGTRVLKVMQNESVIDAVVIVSRWYGGQMLGPVRFEHIETCTREVSRTFRLKDDIVTSIVTLTSLDDTLATLRNELASLKAIPADSVGGTSNGSTADPSLTADSLNKTSNAYAALEESLDLAKAKRLIAARESSIKSVKALLKRAEEEDVPAR